ncbi:MAG: ankyrin repeat domain-containing protein [Bdellovibrionia bacterium]
MKLRVSNLSVISFILFTSSASALATESYLTSAEQTAVNYLFLSDRNAAEKLREEFHQKHLTEEMLQSQRREEERKLQIEKENTPEEKLRRFKAWEIEEKQLRKMVRKDDSQYIHEVLNAILELIESERLYPSLVESVATYLLEIKNVHLDYEIGAVQKQRALVELTRKSEGMLMSVSELEEQKPYLAQGELRHSIRTLTSTFKDELDKLNVSDKFKNDIDLIALLEAALVHDSKLHSQTLKAKTQKIWDRLLLGTHVGHSAKKTKRDLDYARRMLHIYYSTPPKDYSANFFADIKKLDAALISGDFNHVLKMIKAGTAVDYRDGIHGSTPLMFAAQQGRSDVMRVLIDSGADIRAVNKGKSALHFALLAKKLDAALLLIQSGIPVDSVDYQYGSTSLMFAAQEGRADIVRTLLALGANPKAKNKYGNNVKYFARNKGIKSLLR